MRVHSLPFKHDIRRQRDIARHLLPDKMERVVREPHVAAAASNTIPTASGTVFCRSCARWSPDIGLALENTDGSLSRSNDARSAGQQNGAGELTQGFHGRDENSLRGRKAML